MITCVNTIGTVGIMSGIHSLPTPFVKCLVDMVAYNNEYLLQENEQIYYNFANVSYHSMARNRLAREIRGNWILMLDTDQTFPPDVLVRLLWIADQYEIDVLTGLYHQKAEPYNPIIYMLNDDNRFEHIVGWDKDKVIIPIDSAGGGCLLIRNHVLKTMFGKGMLPFAEIEGNSEDHSFFRKLKTLGVRSYCAPDVRVNHLRWSEVDFGMMEVARNG
jgi:GT2 family glycosyltransferase